DADGGVSSMLHDLVLLFQSVRNLEREFHRPFLLRVGNNLDTHRMRDWGGSYLLVDLFPKKRENENKRKNRLGSTEDFKVRGVGRCYDFFLSAHGAASDGSALHAGHDGNYLELAFVVLHDSGSPFDVRFGIHL